MRQRFIGTVADQFQHHEVARRVAPLPFITQNFRQGCVECIGLFKLAPMP